MKDNKPQKRRGMPCVRLSNIVLDAKAYRKKGKSLPYIAGFILTGLKEFVVNNISTIIDDTLDVREAVVDSILKKLLAEKKIADNAANDEASQDNFMLEPKIRIDHDRISEILTRIKEYANIICRKGGSVKFEHDQLVSIMLSDFNPSDKLHFELCKSYLIDKVVEKRGAEISVPIIDEINTHEDLPSSFEVVSQIISKISSPGYEIKELVEIVKTDPALAAKLIKLANSSIFGRTTKTSSLDNAIIYLGKNILRCTAVAIALKPQEYLCEHFDYENFWAQARARSIAAKYSVTKKLGKTDNKYTASESERISRAFTAGLLAKLGTLVYASIWHNDYSVINVLACGNNTMLKRFEKFRFELDHNNLTAELMKSWGFDEDICMAVRLQDDKEQSGLYIDEEYEVLSALVNSPRFIPVILESVKSGLIPSAGSGPAEKAATQYPDIPPEDLEYMVAEYNDLVEIF